MNSAAAKVMSTSRVLLAAVWAVALSSIPSRTDWQRQIDAGTEAAKVVTAYDSVSIFLSIALVVSWVTTGRWLRDAAVASGATRLSPPWGLWGWVVPVVSLWFPRLMVADIIRSKPPTAEPPIPLGTWWATWLGFTFTANTGTVLARLDPTANPYLPNVEIAGACMLTASYFVWQRIVTRIDAPSL